MSMIKSLKPLVRFLYLMGVIAILLWLYGVVTADRNWVNQLDLGAWLRYVLNLAVQFSLGVTQFSFNSRFASNPYLQTLIRGPY